jgi:hypothetical protein
MSFLKNIFGKQPVQQQQTFISDPSLRRASQPSMPTYHTGGVIGKQNKGWNSVSAQRRSGMIDYMVKKRMTPQTMGGFNDIKNVNPYYYARYGNNIKAPAPQSFAGQMISTKRRDPVQRLANWKNIRNTTRKDKLLGYAKSASSKTFKPAKMGLGIGAGIAGIGFGISYGMAAMSRAANKAPVVHTGAIRNTGQTNQYFNMGADPFGGVRFASRKRY